VWKQRFLPREGFFFARVCRDTIARCLKIEDQLQANFNPFLDQGPNGKSAKIRRMIEDKK
jgi:hypothetical protein